MTKKEKNVTTGIRARATADDVQGQTQTGLTEASQLDCVCVCVSQSEHSSVCGRSLLLEGHKTEQTWKHRIVSHPFMAN